MVLTVADDVEGFVVEVESAPDTVSDAGRRSVARENELIELEMLGKFPQFAQPVMLGKQHSMGDISAKVGRWRRDGHLFMVAYTPRHLRPKLSGPHS